MSLSTKYPAVARVAPAFALFFLSPLVGEFLLGNLPITWLGVLVVLAPLYGGGSLLIREVARRFQLAWPGIIVLGLAYGIVEEGFVTQSLFNPNYLGLRLLDYGFISTLGIGAWWTVFVLSLHLIWSTAVPIALVESLTPARRQTPWLGSFGLGVTTFLFVLGCVAIAVTERKKGFVASGPQFAVTALVVLALIAVAFTLGRKKSVDTTKVPAGRAPSPVVVGIVGFVTGGAFFALVATLRVIPASLNVIGTLSLLSISAALNLAWSRRAGWGERHRLALTTGFLLTYVWYGFVQVPSVGNVSRAIDLTGDIIFGLGALVLLARAISRVAKEPASSETN